MVVVVLLLLFLLLRLSLSGRRGWRGPAAAAALFGAGVVGDCSLKGLLLRVVKIVVLLLLLLLLLLWMLLLLVMILMTVRERVVRRGRRVQVEAGGVCTIGRSPGHPCDRSGHGGRRGVQVH